MKTKLGTPDKVKNLSYSNYGALLKKALPPLHNAPEPESYVMISGAKLPWKGAPNNPEQPLFYVGDIKQWVKWLKTQKTITLDDYSFGLCKLTLEGDKAQVRLLSEKGKLAKPTALKEVQKVFKTMKPKVFFEAVEAFDAPVVDTAPQQDTKAQLALAQTLTERHQQFVMVQKRLQTTTDPKQKATTEATRKKLLQALQQACLQWQQQVVKVGTNVAANPELQKGQQLYERWAKQLKLDTGAPQETTAPNSTIQQLAQQAVKDRIHLEESFSDTLHTAPQIEKHIVDLKKLVQQWSNTVKTARQTPSEELQAMQEYIQYAEQDWKVLKPLYTDWFALQQRIKTEGYTEERYRQLTQLTQQMQNI